MLRMLLLGRLLPPLVAFGSTLFLLLGLLLSPLALAPVILTARFPLALAVIILLPPPILLLLFLLPFARRLLFFVPRRVPLLLVMFLFLFLFALGRLLCLLLLLGLLLLLLLRRMFLMFFLFLFRWSFGSLPGLPAVGAIEGPAIVGVLLEVLACSTFRTAPLRGLGLLLDGATLGPPLLLCLLPLLCEALLALHGPGLQEVEQGRVAIVQGFQGSFRVGRGLVGLGN
mmetsp:Transcript_19020/g.40463  ORF Transcript_19020/g.40463 Transcript_19020/m.40463 type:complete len:228 (-) Transcript_19020:33-716(-)